MKNRFASNSALALLAAMASACPSYKPIWSQQQTVIPVVGSLTESLSTASISVAQGGSSTLTVTLTPADGYTGVVQFAPVGAQSGCVLSPASIEIIGADPVAIPMTISCSAAAIASTNSATIVAANSNQAAEAPLSLTVTAAE